MNSRLGLCTFILFNLSYYIQDLVSQPVLNHCCLLQIAYFITEGLGFVMSVLVHLTFNH